MVSVGALDRLTESWAKASDLSPGQKRDLRRITGDGRNITLANLALDHFLARGVIPTDGQFTEYAAERFGLTGPLAPEVRECLYEFACLGSFDMEIPAGLQRTYERLGRPFAELIEPWHNGYRIGSQSVAREVARYLHRRWGDDPDHPLPHPVELARRELDRNGERLYRAQLDRLDLINRTRQGSGEGEAGQLIATTWTAQRRMIDLLVRRTRVDPEWGGNAACAAFAAIALYRAGVTQEADLCAQYVRERWNCGASSLPVWIGDTPTAEAEDFERLRTRMRTEDEASAATEATTGIDLRWPEDLRADRIDVARMHRTWMLGVLLSLEGADPDVHDERIQTLYEAAQEAWLADGGFYPVRIPWMTAWLLIGLCAVGKANSSLAVRAAQWLVNWRGPGQTPPMDWAGGTGQWNSTLMTNAMCLTALLKQGGSGAHHRMQVAYQTLLAAMERQADVISSPVDYGLGIEAILLHSSRGEDRAKAYDKLDELLFYMSARDTWAEPRTVRSAFMGSNPVEADSTELPFTASQVVACVWNVATTELNRFYRESIDGPDDGREQTVVDVEPGLQSPDLQSRVHRAVAVIRATIQDDIAARRTALRTVNRLSRTNDPSPLGEALRRYEDYDREMDGLERLIDDGPVTRELAAALDDLGTRVLGRAYVPCLPRT